MSVDHGVSSSNCYRRTAGMPAAGAHTFLLWIRHDAAQLGNAQSFYGRSTSNAHRLGLNASDQLVLVNGADTITGATTMVADTWYHVAYTRDGSNNHALYLNGVSDGSGSSATNPGNDVVNIGNDEFSAFGHDGKFACPFIFERALTASEIFQQMLCAIPLSTLNLFFWSPLFYDTGTDFSGLGNTFTKTGTVTTIAEGPPIEWEVRRRTVFDFATVGGDLNVALSGSAGTGGHGVSVPNFEIPL